VCAFLCLCTGKGLATSWSPFKGVLPTVLDLLTEVKRKVSWRRPRPELGCRAKGKKKNLKCDKQFSFCWKTFIWEIHKFRPWNNTINIQYGISLNKCSPCIETSTTLNWGANYFNASNNLICKINKQIYSSLYLSIPYDTIATLNFLPVKKHVVKHQQHTIHLSWEITTGLQGLFAQTSSWQFITALPHFVPPLLWFCTSGSNSINGTFPPLEALTWVLTRTWFIILRIKYF
jgi:hypothetical protein